MFPSQRCGTMLEVMDMLSTLIWSLYTVYMNQITTVYFVNMYTHYVSITNKNERKQKKSL
jgi:hypothetical protein